MDEGNIRQELLKVPRETATHVHKLLTKIATNPDEIKYRRLKTTSRLFRERFGDAGALLGALGFAADGDLCARVAEAFAKEARRRLQPTELWLVGVRCYLGEELVDVGRSFARHLKEFCSHGGFVHTEY